MSVENQKGNKKESREESSIFDPFHAFAWCVSWRIVCLQNPVKHHHMDWRSSSCRWFFDRISSRTSRVPPSNLPLKEIRMMLNSSWVGRTGFRRGMVQEPWKERRRGNERLYVATPYNKKKEKDERMKRSREDEKREPHHHPEAKLLF